VANILLVDPDQIAQRAMRGILARGKHRMAAVANATEAKDFIARNVAVDLLVIELELDGGSGAGLTLLQELRRDCFLHTIPVVVYTAHGSRDAVRQALTLGVQNFLIKPYQDSALFMEISKATSHSWRDTMFVPENVLCARLNLPAAEAHERRQSFLQSLEDERGTLQDLARWEVKSGLTSRLEQLAEEAECVGASALVRFFEQLQELVEAGRWPDLIHELDRLAHARRYMRSGGANEPVPEDFATEEERRAAELKQAREQWGQAVAEGRLPVLDQPRLMRELDGLPSCPVADSAAAAFQMSATGHPSSLAPLMDLAERDAGLSAQLLILTNKMRRQDEASDPVDSARLCVGLLGEARLSSLAHGLVAADTSAVDGRDFPWAQYWMFQLGVARVAREICIYLEMESLEVKAYTAGLLHDLGRLLLLHLHPAGLLAVLGYARQHQRTSEEAELALLGWTTREMAFHFAQRRGLPATYCNVLRWIHSPAEAEEDAELTAIVSLARDLCRQNHLGFSGESAAAAAVPLDQTPEWAVLRGRVFPSFSLRKFEAQIQAYCREMKRELSGRGNIAVCA
jgi:CheY-like chemotaxis protein